MRKIVTDKIEKVSVFNASRHELPVVISIPHSGLYVTEAMNNSLRKETVLANMDWYLPDLYDFLKDLGFTVIVNNISRYVVDVNRDINASKDYEDKYTNSLVYMLNTFGKPMYKNKLNKEEIDYRIFKFYQPFHEVLQNALDEKLKHFSKVYLFDLHSFAKEVNADVVLGNNLGSTLDDETTNLVRDLFGQNGFKVTLNKPYKDLLPNIMAKKMEIFRLYKLNLLIKYILITEFLMRKKCQMLILR